jgi:hypothetical protein
MPANVEPRLEVVSLLDLPRHLKLPYELDLTDSLSLVWRERERGWDNLISVFLVLVRYGV